MNITKEQAKMALSVLNAYVKGATGEDLNVEGSDLMNDYVKHLLMLQKPEDFVKLFVDMIQVNPQWENSILPVYQYMEDFDDFFRDVPPYEVASGVAYGKFDPEDDFFYYTMEDEIISVSAQSVMDDASNHFDEVLKYVIDTNRVTELIKNLEKCDKKG